MVAKSMVRPGLSRFPRHPRAWRCCQYDGKANRGVLRPKSIRTEPTIVDATTASRKGGVPCDCCTVSSLWCPAAAGPRAPVPSGSSPVHPWPRLGGAAPRPCTSPEVSIGQTSHRGSQHRRHAVQQARVLAVGLGQLAQCTPERAGLARVVTTGMGRPAARRAASSGTSRLRCWARAPRFRSPRSTRPAGPWLYRCRRHRAWSRCLSPVCSWPNASPAQLVNSDFRSLQRFGLLRSKGVMTRLTNGLGWPAPGIFAVCHAPPQSPTAAGDCGCWLTY